MSRQTIEHDRELLALVGRERALFGDDLESAELELAARIRASSFLVLGGAGSIGQAVVKEIFRRQPRRLHVVDLSENNLVELVRDIRSSHGYIEGDFRTLPLDIGGAEFAAFLRRVGRYDFILNLAAMKHVRSEKDPFTLMRMIRVNVLDTESTLRFAAESGARRYFAVSSDKAADPANAMGATKRVMELCLIRASARVEVSSSRFANVAFSDGSLLHGFRQRLEKRQPLSAPSDVRRYFIIAREAAILCLLSCVVGGNRESLFPAPGDELEALDFRRIAERFLATEGYRAHSCDSEDEARTRVEELAAKGFWPCHFFSSDTTGEKEIEEFWMDGESVELERFREIGVVRWEPLADEGSLDGFLSAVRELRRSGRWSRDDLLARLKALVPQFQHSETGRFLDSRM